MCSYKIIHKIIALTKHQDVQEIEQKSQKNDNEND